MVRKIILDVDTGTDDAVAIMVAALHPDIELIGVSTVFGNLPVANTTDNTLRVLDAIGHPQVPVYRGCAAPLVPSIGAGLDALDHSGGSMHPPVLDLPATDRMPETLSAPEWIVKTLRESDGDITVVAVGAQTNLAAAITLDPTIVPKTRELVIMGGAHAFGNVTPAAEANIWFDPAAAEVVFRAGFERLVMVPLDATHDALIDRDQADELAATGTVAARAAAGCIHQRIEAHDDTQPQAIPHSAPVHDALCIAYLIDPAVIPLEPYHVAIETTGTHTVGRTVIDVRHRGGQEPNAHVALTSDRMRFFEILRDTLGKIE